MNGKKIDEYLYKLLYSRYSLDLEPDFNTMGTFKLFKLKYDLKETYFSPYKIPFYFEVLKERQRLVPENKNAYRHYMLPDGKTLMNINIGETDQDITDQLISMYQNSNMVYWNVKEDYHGGNDESKCDLRHNHDGKKSLLYKIMGTINQYSFEECIPRE